MHKIELRDTSLRTLPRLLQIQAAQNSDGIYLQNDTQSISFAQADSLTDELATGLASLGIGVADRVAIYLENRIELVLLALAVNKLRAIWVPINTDYKGEWLSGVIQDSQPLALITQKSFWQKSAPLLTGCNIEHLIMLDAQSADDIEEKIEVLEGGLVPYQNLFGQTGHKTPYVDIDYGDTCAIVWTSGTTGKSKGVMVSHNGWLRPIYSGSSLFYNSQDGDVIMNVLPMYHAAAWNTSILRGLVDGIPVVIEKHFSVSNFWQRANHFKATQAFTLGAMHMFLWNTPESPDDAKNSIRKLQAVPMPADLARPFEQRFDLELVGSGFGQSECMMIITEAGHEQIAPAGSMGFAANDVEIKLVDQNNHEVQPGDVGEITVRPLEPHIICNGYFNNPKASKECWHGDWYHTGDMGRMDENGAYYFSDRKKDAVRYAGRNISTLEVESIVRRHAEVKDVAAFGIPSTELESEDELKLSVILQDDSTLGPEQLARYINDNAPHYFVPRYIEFVRELPYTPTNKVQKFKLREYGTGANSWDRIHAKFKLERA